MKNPEFYSDFQSKALRKIAQTKVILKIVFACKSKASKTVFEIIRLQKLANTYFTLMKGLSN